MVCQFCGHWCFPLSPRLLSDRSVQYLGVCTAVFKVNKPLLYCLSLWNNIRITLITSSFNWNGVFFSSKSNHKSTLEISFNPLFLKSQKCVTNITVTCELRFQLSWNFGIVWRFTFSKNRMNFILLAPSRCHPTTFSVDVIQTNVPVLIFSVLNTPWGSLLE